MVSLSTTCVYAYRLCASTIQGAWLQTSNVATVIAILHDNPDSPNGSTLKYGSYLAYGLSHAP